MQQFRKLIPFNIGCSNLNCTMQDLELSNQTALWQRSTSPNSVQQSMCFHVLKHIAIGRLLILNGLSKHLNAWKIRSSVIFSLRQCFVQSIFICALQFASTQVHCSTLQMCFRMQLSWHLQCVTVCRNIMQYVINMPIGELSYILNENCSCFVKHHFT